MDNVLLMHINEGTGNLVNDVARLLLVQRSLGDDVIEQLPPAHQFHDDVNLIIGNVDIIQRDDVGMVQAPQGLDLRVELLDHPLEALLDVTLVDDLARVRLAVGPVDAPVAGGGRADSQDFADFVLVVQLLLRILFFCWILVDR